MGEVQKIIEECIGDGVRVGVEKAFREVEQPKKLCIMHEVEQQISWLLEEREAFVWVGLTEEDVRQAWKESMGRLDSLAKALEAKLKEKNT
jgi:hypothetical protein